MSLVICALLWLIKDFVCVCVCVCVRMSNDKGNHADFFFNVKAKVVLHYLILCSLLRICFFSVLQLFFRLRLICISKP